MPQTATQVSTINVAPVAALAVSSAAALPDAVEFQPYSFQYTVSGGVGPFTWSAIAGALPAGLSLSSTGLLSGTPTASGAFSFTVQVVDSGA